MDAVPVVSNSTEMFRAYQLFSGAVNHGDILCKEKGLEEFRTGFLDDEDEIRKISLIDRDGKAFASGCLDQKTGKTFITMVIVERPARRKGLGKEILEELEKKLFDAAPVTDSVSEDSGFEISFFNPMNLTWCVSDKIGVEHPNMPGVDVSSGAYLFFKNCGYRDFAMQNSYYLSLNDYSYPSDMEAKREQLLREGFTLEVYNKSIHSGMAEMMRKLGNPLWEREILEEPMVEEGGRPILVPVYAKSVCGFTGPLDLEKNGRGYFAGIGTDPDFRGRGLAKLLFCGLCEELKMLGADYMTLFTGEQNPARNIYEAAGFRIVRSWADMRKAG